MQIQKIEVYTDGSCLGNPGPGGWAAIILENGENTDSTRHEVSGGEKDTTNNRMEMMAVIEALKKIREQHPDTIQNIKIHFFIDSNLIVQTMKVGWKKKKNLDLWAEIEKLSAWLDITWEWVKAHHENELNNQVDQLAFAEAQGQK